MLNSVFEFPPTSLGTVRNRVPTDVYQLLTLEGDWDEQVKGMIKIGRELKNMYPTIRLHISTNAHDYGSYAGLEVEVECLEEFPDIENDALVIAERLGYDI